MASIADLSISSPELWLEGHGKESCTAGRFPSSSSREPLPWDENVEAEVKVVVTVDVTVEVWVDVTVDVVEVTEVTVEVTVDVVTIVVVVVPVVVEVNTGHETLN